MIPARVASPADPQAARSRLLQRINAGWMTQALATAARLRLPEALAPGPQPVAALAAACGCEPGALHRLLRALVTLEVVQESDDGRFALGELGTVLCSQSGGLGPWAEFCGTASWSVWQRLYDCVRSGRTARELAGGSAGLGYLDSDPQAAALFDAAMASLSHAVAQVLPARLSLQGVQCVVDVGGGSGEVLAALLRAQPSLRGVLFDRPHAAAAAQGVLQQAGVDQRSRFVAGDFFQALPRGGDLYLLKSVLHDWDDEAAGRILRRCREALPERGRLAIIERLLPLRMAACPEHQGIARSDLNMLAGAGGRERTVQQYADLLAGAALQLLGARPLVEGYSVIEAGPMAGSPSAA